MALSAGIWIPHGGDGESFWYMMLMSGCHGTTRIPLCEQAGPMHGRPTRLQYARTFELRSRALNRMLAPLK
jgi:hypothetical protein